MPALARRRGRAEETRAAVLAAAEGLFAERGFTETRLEDVAARVGVKRAALFYYFKDKRALYTAVLESVFGDFLREVQAVVARENSDVAAIIQAVVSRWVEYVWERPATAYLLLHESARRPESELTPLAQPFLAMLRQIFAEGKRQGVFSPITDPHHFGATIVGSTIFFVAAMPRFVADLPFDPLSPDQLEIHRRDVLRVTRRLLGLSAPRQIPT